MPVIVTVTTSPVNPTTETPAHQYVQVTAENYESARDEALARVPQGWRAVAIRADRSYPKFAPESP